MEELKIEGCSICGISREEQEFQQAHVSVEFRMLYARWKQRNDPNEPAPGLPVTHEYRIHYALWLYQKYISEGHLPIAATGRAAYEPGVDYNSVVRVLNHVSKA